MNIILENIPSVLRELPNWVLWKFGTRDGKETKLPFQVNGTMAKADDASTWTTFDSVCAAYKAGGYSGIGFEFSANDPFCGVDLDGCRNPTTGVVAEWAKDIILLLGTYAEVSPSQAGVKLFIRAKSPFATGKKKLLKDAECVSDKTPAIEIYDWGRYFAVTGWTLKGQSTEPEHRQNELEEIIGKYFQDEPSAPASSPAFDFRSNDAVAERARKYLAKLPPAISGQDGHGRTFHAACVLVLGFGLSDMAALPLMQEYNQACQPPWSDKELLHKIRSAGQQPGERNYLRNAKPDRLATIAVPAYQESPPVVERKARETTIWNATCDYIDKLRNGENSLITLGIGDLDYAIGGGVEKGEMIILAARPSHGKSAVGLQCIHHWTAQGMRCAIISEEMAALALGKRTVQFLSNIPKEHWGDLMPDLEAQVEEYGRTHEKCIVLEGCGTAEVARKEIERVVKDEGVQCVVVDYAQLLGGQGKDRYQQMTNMSVTLRQLASSQKIVLMALCQMSRTVESRSSFSPQMSDIKETGQLEQDADVIVFLCWPSRIDKSIPENKYEFFIEKNRNRGINQKYVTCRFNPERQKFLDPLPERRHEEAFGGRGSSGPN